MAEETDKARRPAEGRPGGARRSSRLWWWVAGGATGLVLLLAAGAVWYWGVGQTVWTDDRGIRLPDSHVSPRYVLWTDPKALPEAFTTADQEYEPSVSPDGYELYFVRGLPGKGTDIYVSLLRNYAWTDPVPVAAVNTAHDELGPRLTPDGRHMLFYSNRPGGLGQYDIWASRRTEDGWGEPFNLGAAVNSKYNEYGAACDPDGRLYFATDRKSAARRRGKVWKATIRQTQTGDYDLFVAEPVKPTATAPRTPAPGTMPATAPAAEKPPLAFAQANEVQGVNTPHHEGACCVTPSGDFLYLASNRPGGLGGFDLYRCRLRDGRCVTLVNLGAEVNTPANESDPQLAMGGFEMYFSSDRGGEQTGYDLFRCEAREVYAHRISRPLPSMGWQMWVLLAGLALLVPLLLFLKAGGYRHLSLLQKCFFVSLMSHVLFMVLFGAWEFSKPIIIHIAKEAGMTIAVNLEVSREFEVGQQIRQQITADLPVADPSLADLAKVEEVVVPRVALQPTEINVPRVRFRPAAMTIQPEALKKIPPEPTEELSLPPPKLLTDEPTIELRIQKPLAQADPEEVKPEPVPVEVRRAAAPPPKPKPREIELKTEQARLRARSLARVLEMELPKPVPTERVATEVRLPEQTDVKVRGPEVHAAPVKAARPESPEVTEARTETARLARPAPPEAAPPEIRLAAAKTRVERRSLARATEAEQKPPTEVEAVQARVKLPEQAEVKVTAPAVRAAPVRSVSPEAPTVAEAEVKADRMAPAAPVQVAPEEIQLAAAKADVQPRSLARATEAEQKPPAEVEAVQVRVKLPEQAEVKVTAPAVQAAPIRSVSPEPPTVAEAEVKADRVTPASPARAAAPSDIQLAAAKGHIERRSLARPTPSAPKTPLEVEQIETQMQLPEHGDVKVTGPEVTAAPMASAQPEGPNVAEEQVATDRLSPASPAQAAAPGEIKLSAAKRVIERRSLARAVLVEHQPVGRAERVAPTVKLPPAARVEVSGPAVPAGPAVAAGPEGPAVAEAAVRVARVETPGAVPQAAASETVLKPSPAGARAGSLLQAAVGPRAAPAEAETLAAEVELAALPALDVAGPAVKASPVASRRAASVVVSDVPIEIRPLPTGSPRARPSLAKVALPAAKAVPRSLVVAASANQRKSTQRALVSLDVPAAKDAVEVKLPVLAEQRTSRGEQPLVATAVEAPRPMEARTVSGFRPERPAELPRPVRSAVPTKAAAASLVHQPLSAVRRPRPAESVADRVTPRTMLAKLEGSLGPGKLASPESFFQRSFEQRRRLLQEMGGTKESEAAVGRALVYLSQTQQPDGRWTYMQHRGRGRQPKHQVDTAVTGLAVLCFLAADHTPDKEGPYRQAVTKGAEYLIAQGKPNGDLRGRGRMYGQAIVTLALAEAAIMTGDLRYRQVAVKGAEFIVKAQNPRSGGWRYSPGDEGDTSVLGWQIMALRSVEKLGYKIPDRTRTGTFRWLDRVSTGPQKMLSGYTGPSPTPSMTAEAVFSRILFGQRLTQAQQQEVCDYLLRNPPGKGPHSFYYWYYASLALMQMQNEAWAKWNTKMRQFLIKLQQKRGDADGSWDTKSQYGSRGGRIYTTTLAALTLEVYYRYLPMYGPDSPGPEKAKPGK